MLSRISAWSVYNVFTLAEGEQLFIGAVSDNQWSTLCEVLQSPDLANDPTLQTNAQRVAVRPALLQRLDDVLKHHRPEDLSPKLKAAGIPYPCHPRYPHHRRTRSAQLRH